MGYCTVDDVKNTLSEDILLGLTDYDDLGIVDDARIQRVIDRASAHMDTFLSVRHELPLPEPHPASLKAMCIDLVTHILFLDRGGQIPKDIAKRRDEIERTLKLIAQRKAGIGDISTVEGLEKSPLYTVRSPYITDILDYY